MIEIVLSLSGVLRWTILLLMGSQSVLEWGGCLVTQINYSSTLAARFQPVTILCCDGTGASRRKLTKAKSIYSQQKTKLTKKRGGSLSIFAVLTARTLYTYKYEVAINNDKVQRPAFSFLSRDLLWNVTFVGSAGRPTCPAGRRTLRLLRTQVPQGTRRRGRRGAGGQLGRASPNFGSQFVESWD